jgi:hypothetical protein
MPAALMPMEFAAIEQLSKDQRNLLFDDPRAVVLDCDAKTAWLRLVDPHPDLRNDARFLAGIQRVIDRFFDGRQKSFAWVIEPEKVFVFRKKLADRDITLLGRHRLGGRAARFFASDRTFFFVCHLHSWPLPCSCRLSAEPLQTGDRGVPGERRKV